MAQPKSLAVVNQQFQGRARTIAEHEKRPEEWVYLKLLPAHASQRIDSFPEIDGLVGDEHLQLGNDLNHARELPAIAPSTNRHIASINPSSEFRNVTTLSVP